MAAMASTQGSPVVKMPETDAEREAGAEEYRKLVRGNAVMAAAVAGIPVAEEFRQQNLFAIDVHEIGGAS